MNKKVVATSGMEAVFEGEGSPDNFQLEMQESKAEQAYCDGMAAELLETFTNILPLMSSEQIDTMIAAAEVELRERDCRANEYTNDLPF